jgi:hypothetical protein
MGLGRHPAHHDGGRHGHLHLIRQQVLVYPLKRLHIPRLRDLYEHLDAVLGIAEWLTTGAARSSRLVG